MPDKEISTLEDVRKVAGVSQSRWKDFFYPILAIISTIAIIIALFYLVDAQGFQDRQIQGSRRAECSRQIDSVYDDLYNVIVVEAVRGNNQGLNQAADMLDSLGPKGELIEEVCPKIEDVPDYTNLIPQLLGE